MAEPELKELFEHLREEHNRVLNDAVYYQKCIQVLEKYRKMFIIFNNNTNDCTSVENQFMFNVLEDLETDYKKVFKEENQITHPLRQQPVGSQMNLKELIKSFIQNGTRVNNRYPKNNNDFGDDMSDSEDDTEDSEDYQDSYVDIESNSMASNSLLVPNSKPKRARPKSSPSKNLGCDWPGCEYMARDRYALTSHVRSVHTMEKPFKCPICSRCFTREDKLKEHRRRHEKPDVMYRCKYENCKFATPHKQNLYSHETRHQNIRKFKCTEKDCPMSFFHMSELRRHTNTVHSEARPYLCDWPGCEVTYKSRQLLNDHKRTHLGLREFKCDFEGCAKTFVTGKRLYSHKLQHTKPYVCTWPECGHRYGSNRELKAHMNRHQDVRPFNCPIIGCFHCFHSRPLLNAHLRDVHRNATLENSHSRPDSLHSRPDSMHGRNDSIHGRNDSLHGRNDSMHSRPDQMHSRPDPMQSRPDAILNNPIPNILRSGPFENIHRTGPPIQSPPNPFHQMNIKHFQTPS